MPPRSRMIVPNSLSLLRRIGMPCMAVCICWKRSDDKWRAMLGRCRYCLEKMVWPGGVGSLVRMSRACENMSEMVGRPLAFFRIGEVFTYDAALPPGANYPFHQVTEADVWSDDPRSPNYNRHIVIDPRNPPDNYSHEKMRGGDFAYRWLVEIRHNSDPPVPGDGSAIFFHIRRGVNRPTTGCTTMAEPDLVRLVSGCVRPNIPATRCSRRRIICQNGGAGICQSRNWLG